MDDLISRQTAIKIIKNYCENGCDIAEDNWCPSCQREQFIKLLEALPSAQPEPIKITIDHAPTPDELERLKQAMRNTPVMLLPSAQPEIIRCIDCKHSVHWYRDRARCFLWREEGIYVFEDGYCSYAERRTGG